MSAVATPAVDLLSVLRALGDPTRLAIVRQLAERSASACEVRERLEVSAPLLSHHLRVLREAGLVRCNRVGRQLQLELRSDAFGVLTESLPGRRQ